MSIKFIPVTAQRSMQWLISQGHSNEAVFQECRRVGVSVTYQQVIDYRKHQENLLAKQFEQVFGVSL